MQESAGLERHALKARKGRRVQRRSFLRAMSHQPGAAG